MTEALFCDLSSNNGTPNLRKHWKAGYRLLVLKATEGADYTWDQHGQLADAWHKRGGTVWHYHFARPGNGAAQAARFVSEVGPHFKRGDRIVLDVEIVGVDPAFVRDFTGTCQDKVPTWPGLVYSYASFLTVAKIRPVNGWGWLWLADYETAQPTAPAGWRLVAWQFTQTGTAPGVAGHVDQSRLLDPSALPDPKQPATRLALSTRAALRLATRHLRTRHNSVAVYDWPVLEDAQTQIERVRGLK